MVSDFSQVFKLAADLGQAGAKAGFMASAAIAKTALDIEADAKIMAPVDTGNLRNSISSTVGKLHAEVGPTASYGVFLEYGTSRMGPQPFLGPAFDRNAPGLEKAIGLIGGRIL